MFYIAATVLCSCKMFLLKTILTFAVEGFGKRCREKESMLITSVFFLLQQFCHQRLRPSPSQSPAQQRGLLRCYFMTGSSKASVVLSPFLYVSGRTLIIIRIASNCIMWKYFTRLLVKWALAVRKVNHL